MPEPQDLTIQRRIGHLEADLKITRTAGDQVREDFMKHVLGCEELGKRTWEAVEQVKAILESALPALQTQIDTLKQVNLEERTAAERKATFEAGREQARKEMRATVKKWAAIAMVPFAIIAGITYWLANVSQISTAWHTTTTESVTVKHDTSVHQ